MSKIALFSAQYEPHVGGIERYVKCLAIELSKRGHDVFVVTSNLYGYESIQKKDGLTIINMPCHNFLDGRLPFTKKNSEFKRLAHYIENIGLDLIVINARFYTQSVFAAKLACKNKIKSICIEHGSSYIAFNKVYIDWLVHLYEHVITIPIKKYCKNFFAVSTDGSNWVKTFGITSKGEIHNAINVDEVEAEIGEHECLNFLKECKGPVITYVGRVIERKGILEMIGAVKKMAEKMPEIKLVIAGDGELMEQVKEQADENVVLLGMVKHDVALSLISKADVFVLASETEGFPTSVLESMACKTFVITTYAGGSKEIIQDESYGLLIKDNSTSSIYAALEKALSSEEYRKAAAEKSYECVRDNYSWKNSADVLESIMADDNIK